MGQILEGLDGVLCQMDDVLVFGSNQQEHDFRLHAVLKAIKAAGVTLNSEKCSFSVDKLKFLGHVISRDGVSADPDKTKAILQMKPPTNITELRRFMGMVNQLGKFSPNVAQISQPLRELLSTKSAWVWGTSQDHAFSSVKTELTRPTVLALYNPMAETLVSADASSNGLGAVLLQKFEAEWRPVVFASRSMSETETRYAQIEKEALAITWACDKFSIYILGRQFTVETDHKPLVPLLSSKQLDSLPPRILRFRLRLMRYHFNIKRVPGKLMYTADTLSRAPTSVPGTDCEVLQDDAELFAAQVIAHLPASKARMDVYRSSQTSDPVMSAVIKYCRFGWPEKHRLQLSELRVYWSLRGELTVYDGLLFFGKRLVIPQALQEETRQSLHQGHQGIQRCQLRASSCVWWPGISKDLERFVKQCLVCAKRSVPRKEPMIPSELPKYPWQKVGTDLFEMKGATFLLVVDYFSRYVETTKLASTTSSAVITALKSIFARFGVPEIVVSDNGPQFVSKEMKEFSELYRFQHTTSSPHYPQSNGQAERAVQTIKRLLTMLCYRATPLSWCGLSPAQLLMGRLIRTNIPQISEHLVPKMGLPGSEIPIGTDVWVSSGGTFHLNSFTPPVSGEGDLAELQHLRVLCRAQGDRIEQMGKRTAARDEENERNMRIIRHEKTVAMEELDKMAKLYRELEASKEGLGREMAALREQVGEERGRVQTLEDSRKEVRELSSSDLLSRVRDGYTSAQTQTKELHAQQVATLKEELDVVRHDSEAKTEAIQQLQSEIQDLHARLGDLTAVKEEYTLLWKEKNQLAVELEQLKARQLGTVTSKERDEAVAKAKAEWREQMMRENAAMVEKALQESQRSWELRKS
ncbi:hypothetical protein EMCRGX_G003010 [Ephydatia muelleri]